MSCAKGVRNKKFGELNQTCNYFPKRRPSYKMPVVRTWF